MARQLLGDRGQTMLQVSAAVVDWFIS